MSLPCLRWSFLAFFSFFVSREESRELVLYEKVINDVVGATTKIHVSASDWLPVHNSAFKCVRVSEDAGRFVQVLTGQGSVCIHLSSRALLQHEVLVCARLG